MSQDWEVLTVDNDYEINVNYPHVIKRSDTGRIVSEYFDKDGYVIVNLNLYKKATKKHQIIALQWIPNPNNLPQINHINHNRADNRIENLEWVSNQQNANDKHIANNGREVEYVDKLPDNAIVVNHYNNCTFNNYYFADDRFFKQADS